LIFKPGHWIISRSVQFAADPERLDFELTATEILWRGRY